MIQTEEIKNLITEARHNAIIEAVAIVAAETTNARLDGDQWHQAVTRIVLKFSELASQGKQPKEETD